MNLKRISSQPLESRAHPLFRAKSLRFFRSFRGCGILTSGGRHGRRAGS